LIDWSQVEGLGSIRDEVIAERLSVSVKCVRDARERLGIHRRTGPTGWKRRVDLIARDPASASVADVSFLVDCIKNIRRRADSARKAANVSRLRSDLRAAKCVIWVMYSEEEVESLTGKPAAVYRDTVDSFSEAILSWWGRRAVKAGEDVAWADRNAEHDPAPPEFLRWAMKTGKIDEQAKKARAKRLRSIVSGKG